jgi:hypothetical protein
MSNSIYYVSDWLYKKVRPRDAIVTIGHVYDPRSSVQSLKTQVRSKLRLTEYTADVTTQETDCRYKHHIKSIQNYQTIVCRRATLRAVKYASAIEYGGMGFTKFEAHYTQDNDETYESPPVNSDIGVRIIKANDTTLEYTL